MPSQADHINKAERNRDFADAMRPVNPTVVGWSLVVLFYSALHYVEAFHAKHHTHCTTHKQRNGEISRNPQLSVIYRHYQELSDFSWNARYQCASYSSSELAQARESLKAVETHIQKLL